MCASFSAQFLACTCHPLSCLVTSTTTHKQGIPKVKVCVENSEPKLSILIDPQEFLPKLSLLKVSYAHIQHMYINMYICIYKYV